MTRKMMDVIYRAFKEGKLPKTTQDDISAAYTMIDKLGNEIRANELRNYHRDAYAATLYLKNAVDAIFRGDYEKADNIVWGFASNIA